VAEDVSDSCFGCRGFALRWCAKRFARCSLICGLATAAMQPCAAVTHCWHRVGCHDRSQQPSHLLESRGGRKAIAMIRLFGGGLNEPT
jgi:hypothetical protein